MTSRPVAKRLRAEKTGQRRKRGPEPGRRRAQRHPRVEAEGAGHMGSVPIGLNLPEEAGSSLDELWKGQARPW